MNAHKFRGYFALKMEEFWVLLVLFFATNLMDKSESVQLEKLEELPLQTFDEIFGEGWWDNDKADEWDKLTLEQNFHHQIDRQNIQLGQIEPNSIDQNAPLTESDHYENAKNGEEMNSNEKRKIIVKFHAMKNEFKKIGKFSVKERNQIEEKIAKDLKVSRKKIYKWKKELGISGKTNGKEERKHFVEKFDQMKAELKRDGFKSSFNHELDKTVAKGLGLSDRTIYNWKRDLSQTAPKYPHSEQNELMKHYYEIKGQTPKISDEDIAKTLNIGRCTLSRWKKQFKRDQLDPNSVDGHSVEENAAANIQEIGNSNSGSI